MTVWTSSGHGWSGGSVLIHPTKGCTRLWLGSMYNGVRRPRMAMSCVGIPSSSSVSLRAVIISDGSWGSMPPPGKEICPAWWRSVLGRRVNRTERPAGPGWSRIRTADCRMFSPGGMALTRVAGAIFAWICGPGRGPRSISLRCVMISSGLASFTRCVMARHYSLQRIWDKV